MRDAFVIVGGLILGLVAAYVFAVTRPGGRAQTKTHSYIAIGIFLAVWTGFIAVVL